MADSSNVRERVDTAFGLLTAAIGAHGQALTRLNEIAPDAAGYLAPTFMALCQAATALAGETQAITEAHASMAIVLGEK